MKTWTFRSFQPIFTAVYFSKVFRHAAYTFMLICKTIIYMSMTSYQLKIIQTRIIMMTLTSHNKSQQSLQIRDVYPESRIVIFFHPGSRISEATNFADLGCLSWIPDPDFFPPRIPDLRSDNNKKGGKNYNKQNVTKAKFIFFLNRYKSLRYRDWGSGVRDPVSENTHNGSRIRIQR